MSFQLFATSGARQEGYEEGWHEKWPTGIFTTKFCHYQFESESKEFWDFFIHRNQRNFSCRPKVCSNPSYDVILECSKSSLVRYAMHVFPWRATSRDKFIHIIDITNIHFDPVHHKWPRLTATQTVKRRNIPSGTNWYANKSFKNIFEII